MVVSYIEWEEHMVCPNSKSLVVTWDAIQPIERQYAQNTDDLSWCGCRQEVPLLSMLNTDTHQNFESPFIIREFTKIQIALQGHEPKQKYGDENTDLQSPQGIVHVWDGSCAWHGWEFEGANMGGLVTKDLNSTRDQWFPQYSYRRPGTHGDKILIKGDHRPIMKFGCFGKYTSPP